MKEMSVFEIVSIIATIIGFFGGGMATVVWFMLKNVIGMVIKVQNSLNEHIIYSLQEFVKGADFKDSVKDLKGSMNVMQNALNTNTNMTSVVSERISALIDRLNHKP